MSSLVSGEVAAGESIDFCDYRKYWGEGTKSRWLLLCEELPGYKQLLRPVHCMSSSYVPAVNIV